MKYQSVPGYFDFEGFYSEVVGAAPDGSTLIEVGSWLGKSVIYLAEVVKASGKDIRIFAVDTWRGSWQHKPEDQALLQSSNGSVYEHFMANIRRCGVDDIIAPIQLPSVEAAKTFKDHSAFMVYIDALHTYEDCRDDIAAWRKKVQPGGMLAGHDYGWGGADKVQRAVDEAWPNGVRLLGATWAVTSDKL